jgi:hypothetical protein
LFWLIPELKNIFHHIFEMRGAAILKTADLLSKAKLSKPTFIDETVQSEWIKT